jgi:isoleucyl-tRNA synthetase
MDYKNTLNLPQTGFAMKADLVSREPQRLEKWTKANLYERIQAQRANAEKFILHDGPPFANGDVHIGTALNKIVKDFIIKYQTLRGKNAPYIPGWDCHGLPIEFKVTQEMRKQGQTAADPATIRNACEAYARKYIDLQRVQFKRLGVLGDWDNPYLTLNKQYEADELRLISELVEKGFVYRGKKPVYWSIPARTALAEAEVEYNDHVSQSVYVKFPVVGQPNTSILIWTTTPWTLPANLAVAYNSTFSYSEVLVGAEKYILFTGLLESVTQKCGWQNPQTVRTLGKEALQQLEYQHPFCARTGKLYTGDTFVESSTGTGFVHIAPGHGLEDYALGRTNGLPIYSPVDDDGRFAYTQDLPQEKQMPAELIGKSILEKNNRSDANEAVLELLKSRNALVFQEAYPHSYPFCWRSKTPVIFRAMDQWFIKVDHQDFRQKALQAIDSAVRWVPDWGKARIEAAVKSRPDWCISRQRTWGVPIPAFYDAAGQPILDARIVRNVADIVEQHGSNIWFEKSFAELWAAVRPKDWQGPEAVNKSNDTLDVWIDSGSSSRSVLMRRSELQRKLSTNQWQADMYFEGSDQHRGWFQSSLLLSLAANGAPPYKTVLTHGFMVDADREKISKSKQEGAYIKPQTSEAYVKKHGADVVRLWVASQDFRNDIVVSEERIGKVGEMYRVLRNALRYQLSNLYDFDPAEHTVPNDKLNGLDRWILDVFGRIQTDVTAAFDNFEYHVVYQKLSQFAAVELSAVYHDVIKDRLYTDAPNSPRRRSTQTALYQLITGLCQMLAPILAFTTDEAWEFVPGKKTEFVHLSDWPAHPLQMSEAERAHWEKLFKLREIALPELEKARQAKLIGKALEARLTLAGNLDLSPQDRESLRELLNVSQLEIAAGSSEVTASVTKAEGQKCERCWHWETDIGKNPAHPTLCSRCVVAVTEAPTRPDSIYDERKAS